MVASSYAAHELSYPAPGWAEQDPEEWKRALVQTLAEIRLTTDGRPIAAVSFGSQLDGLVATDGAGRVMRPALIWSDRRAVAECLKIAGNGDRERLRARTGCNLDPGHVGAKIAWLRANEPETYRVAAAFLLPGSWVAREAAGELAVDPTNASSTGLLDARELDWCEEACDAFEIDTDRLAPVHPSDAVLGPIAGWLREATGLPAGTQVVLGAGDEMAAVLGAGVTEPGEVCDVIGTAEPVCAVIAEPALNSHEVVELHPHAVPDRWLLENPGWLSGGAYRWFRDELGGPEVARAAATGADVYELLNALALGAPPGADGVRWIPALSGAMAPEWNPRARAGWFGLTAAHGRAHMARALLEGNALALRDIVDAIAAGGHQLTGLVCVGGGARGDLLLRIRADMTGLRVCRPHDVETTARGAAMLAAAGIGLHASVVDAARAMAGPRTASIEPDAGLRAIYDDLHAQHLRLYDALRPLFG